jgi:hypothetical protein
MHLEEFSLPPFEHHDTLNPLLWHDMQLAPDVRRALLKIAKHFLEFIGVPDLKLKDITISGSNASFGYSKFSDIDLHLVAKDTAEQEELFTAKKNQYNSTYDIKIKDIPVELYVQDSDQKHHSAGIYSVLKDQWIKKPSGQAPTASPQEIKRKARNYAGKINSALRSGSITQAQEAMEELRRLRSAGLETNGEHSVENLAFKLLRARGQIDKLRKYINKQTSANLSIEEEYED